jgi:hypothetical protein
MRQSALPLPSRYQHHINLLRTFDKLARGCGSVAARWGALPPRYLPAPAVDGRGKMPASKRVLNLNFWAWKPEPIIEAETVITLLYHVKAVAPEVWFDTHHADEVGDYPGGFGKSSRGMGNGMATLRANGTHGMGFSGWHCKCKVNTLRHHGGLAQWQVPSPSFAGSPNLPAFDVCCSAGSC